MCAGKPSKQRFPLSTRTLTIQKQDKLWVRNNWVYLLSCVVLQKGKIKSSNYWRKFSFSTLIHMHSSAENSSLSIFSYLSHRLFHWRIICVELSCWCGEEKEKSLYQIHLLFCLVFLAKIFAFLLGCLRLGASGPHCTMNICHIVLPGMACTYIEQIFI